MTLAYLEQAGLSVLKPEASPTSITVSSWLRGYTEIIIHSKNAPSIAKLHLQMLDLSNKWGQFTSTGAFFIYESDTAQTYKAFVRFGTAFSSAAAAGFS